MLRSLQLGRALSTATRRCRIVRLEDRGIVNLHWAASSTCCKSYIRCFGSTSRLSELGIAESTRKTSHHKLTKTSPETTDFAKSLPIVCPGCGAMSQMVESDAPGFYSPKKHGTQKDHKQHEQDIYEQAMARLSAAEDAYPFSEMPTETDFIPAEEGRTICDRCHDLLHQSTGTSILHPSMQSIQDIIESSPHRHNHIYHVLDAADFPLSLIPNLISALKLPRLRTQNRRSKSKQYINGREADVSFIITRSDLLAPQKEQVDRLMPYLQEVLRDALGRAGKNVRLGNVRCVSAKRGWWTPAVKEEIWKRGGAGWVVGKVNVGKSALFEAVYPKGRNVRDNMNPKTIRAAKDGAIIGTTSLIQNDEAPGRTLSSSRNSSQPLVEEQDPAIETVKGMEANIPHDQGLQRAEFEENEGLDDDDIVSLLPPAQIETQFPHMPIISALPGTTASPIRIPYGNGKGELIDLPGVMRSSIETHVKPEHHSSLVMKSRVVPEQFSVKPGQSLLLGGVIRITPKTDDLVFLAYPFVPLKAHLTGTEKAIAIQTGEFKDGTPYAGTIDSVATEKAKGRMKSAGTFKLEWDVTKKRAGPVTDKTAGKQKAEDLPFVVYGADILIEGIGWVEIVCQVRNRRKSLINDALSVELRDDGNAATSDNKPEIEVFTPKGKFIGIRAPMNAWLQSGPKLVAKHAQRKRPRMSISLQKRKEGGRRGSRTASMSPD